MTTETEKLAGTVNWLVRLTGSFGGWLVLYFVLVTIGLGVLLPFGINPHIGAIIGCIAVYVYFRRKKAKAAARTLPDAIDEL